MPVNSEVAQKQWYRYAWCRDNGHSDFVDKADKCERFFRGDQWDAIDKAVLASQRRPALTINKIISTLSNVMGEQIYNRSEISFRPRGQASEATADILSKVYKYLSDNNQLDWVRSDMFADGAITSRGFIDIRMSFDQSVSGDITLETLNPKNVLIDPDAIAYDPDTWNEVFVTKWLTVDDIEMLYSKEDATYLRGRETSSLPFGYDSVDYFRDRFGQALNPAYGGTYDQKNVQRSIRVIERQYRVLDRQDHFLSTTTGDTRQIPSNWDRNRIVSVKDQFGLSVIKKLVKRIKWTVTADNVVLHDDWSPYKHFTPVPYFPYFRHGRTIGMVENLIDPQELLNKTSSQELHIANTTANSGYKVKKGSLTNMSIEELEDRGAETGLVIEVNGDPDKDIIKITPNTVPTALDRISFKAEDHIDKISGVSASQKGFDREDVAAKAIQAKRQAGQTNLAKPLDGLVRTDYMIARNVLDLIQTYMTEPQILTITKDAISGENEQVSINQVSPEGEVINDVMLGEYDIVVSSIPQRETLEDSEFEQLSSMRKDLGVKIPDSVLIGASRLRNKKEVLKKMEDEANSAAAQAQAQLQQREQEAQIKKIEAEATSKQADTGLRAAKTQTETVKAQQLAQTPPDNPGQVEAEKMQLEGQRAEHQMSLDERKFAMEQQHMEEKAALEEEISRDKMRLAKIESNAKMQLQEKQAADKAHTDRVARLTQPST